MTEELKHKVLEVVHCKIKEPISDDLILAGEKQVRAKLLIQNRFLNDLDHDYLARLIAESMLQIMISCESIHLLKSLANIS